MQHKITENDLLLLLLFLYFKKKKNYNCMAKNDIVSKHIITTF